MFKLKPSLGLRSTGLYFLGNCYSGCWWRVEFRVPLLTLLQLQSCLVPCISVRIFIIPKLQNFCWRTFISHGELFSLCIEHLPDCSVRHFPSYLYTLGLEPVWDFREHLSRALPTEMIFNLLRSTRSERLMRDYSTESMFDTLEIIIKWLQVSVSECNRQAPQTKKSICV